MTFDEWYRTVQSRATHNRSACKNAWDAAAKAEREECAKMCDISPELEDRDILGGEEGVELCRSLAASIRMRSNVELTRLAEGQSGGAQRNES